MLRVTLLAVLLFATSSTRAQQSLIEGAVRVDGVQVVVGGLAPGPGVILILQSDVELRARMALLRAAGEAQALGPLPADLLRAAQAELLGEALIALEAERLALAAPTQQAVLRERQRLVMGAGGRDLVFSFLDKLGVTMGELDATARRRVIVSSFLEANLVGTADLTVPELERAHERGDHPFRDRPFDEVREALRGYLAQRSLEQAVGRWVEGLKQRIPHRVLLGY